MSVVHAPSLSASKITKAELDSLQTRYDQLIEDLTAQEDAKVQKHGRGPGELLILDRTRFNTIPQGLTKRKEEGPDKGFLEKEEIEELVRWKLYVHSAPLSSCFLPSGTYSLSFRYNDPSSWVDYPQETRYVSSSSNTARCFQWRGGYRAYDSRGIQDLRLQPK